MAIIGNFLDDLVNLRLHLRAVSVSFSHHVLKFPDTVKKTSASLHALHAPCSGGKAERETDTMPQWAGSSWYFLRYIDPDNDKEFASKEALEYWMPVDWYNGGMA